MQELSTLKLEFQASALKLLVFNYVIVLLIANQNVISKFSFEEHYLPDRFGYEFIEPTVLTKFGFCFRLLTILMNTSVVATILEPKRQRRYFLLPSICWNFYLITAITWNVLENIWSMIQLDVPITQMFSTFIVSIFIVAFQTNLTLQVLQFYEYLNYIYL